VGWIRGTCVVFLVARIAERAVQRIVVVYMAIGALTRRRNVRASQRESRSGVIEFTVRPKHSVVAAFTCSWEVGRDVVHRRGRRVVVVHVARRTCRAGQVVVAVDVAIRALPRRRQMRTAQSESRAVVIEFAIRPKHAVVAGLTCSREMGGDVVYG